MEEVKVRPATAEDIPVLLRFEQGVVSAERPMDPTIREGHIEYYNLPHMIESEHILLVVAELDGVIIGSGYARIEPADRHYLNYTRHAYLGFMYTEPAHRGKGVNRVIIAALEEWARKRHITEMVLEVYHANEPAIAAYERAGFGRHLIRMRKGIL